MSRHWNQRAKQIALPLIGACIAAYFSYHAINGERGLIAWLQLHQQVKAAHEELDRLATDRKKLERRVALLTNATLDQDMLDERARAMLNFASPTEKVIFLENSSATNAAPRKP